MYESWGEKLATPSDYDPKKRFFSTQELTLSTH